MAGIDRLYTRNVEDYIAFFAWMEKYAPELRDYTFTYSRSNSGSWLTFKSEKLASYAAKQFIDIYKDFVTL